MARVIIHHAHHKDEGVYRLIHAEEVEIIVGEVVEKTHADHREIIWDANDPMWREVGATKTAEYQRKAVRKALDIQEKEARDAAQPSEVRHLRGSAGTTL